jgi:hypothetical protein
MARDLMRTSPSSVCASTRQTEDAMRHDLLILSGHLLRPVVSRLSLRSSTSAAEPPVDTKTALAAPAVAKPASDAGDQDPAAVAAAQAKANAVTAAFRREPPVAMPTTHGRIMTVVPRRRQLSLCKRLLK